MLLCGLQNRSVLLLAPTYIIKQGPIRGLPSDERRLKARILGLSIRLPKKQDGFCFSMRKTTRLIIINNCCMALLKIYFIKTRGNLIIWDFRSVIKNFAVSLSHKTSMEEFKTRGSFCYTKRALKKFAVCPAEVYISLLKS